jgi:hypothetical protein
MWEESCDVMACERDTDVGRIMQCMALLRDEEMRIRYSPEMVALWDFFLCTSWREAIDALKG